MFVFVFCLLTFLFVIFVICSWFACVCLLFDECVICVGLLDVCDCWFVVCMCVV